MKGSAHDERRTERLQALMVLGLLADNVALAALHYPEQSTRETDALRSFDQLLDDVEKARPSDRRTFPPRKSMTDPAAMLSHAAYLVGQSVSGTTTSTPDLGSLREPIRQLIAGQADDGAVAAVKAFSQLLGRTTLRLAEEVVQERSTEEWTEKASLFSAA
jgi:hypothetical protein